MTVVYPVIFTKTGDKKDTYLVDIPDIDGISEGYGLTDAIDMARDLIGCKLYEKADDDIPSSSSLENIDAQKGRFADAGESFTSLVDLDLTAYRRSMNKRAVRKNVSIPEWLAKEAEDAHINLSRALQEILKEKLDIT